MSSDSESDIELHSALPTKIVPKKAPPRSPSDDLKTKKITTKMMIVDALTELKTRKGVSLYAIKKFLTEKYNVNTEKVNYLIKKSIKVGVEDGTFIQMKGVGASGSFKLANIEKPKIKKKPKKIEKTEKSEPKTTKTEKKTEKSKEEKKPKKMEIKKKEKDTKKPTKKTEKPEKSKKNELEPKPKKAKVKTAKEIPSPTKKRSAMAKRKSIGSIIKKPKMKPQSHA